MKKLIGLIILIGLVSCQSTKPIERKTSNKVDIGEGVKFPQWVINPSFDGKIAEIGIAPKSRGGIRVQRSIALADAKGKLAQRLQSNISTISKVAIQQAKTNNLADDVVSTFEEGTKSLVRDLPLSGVQQVNITMINGELYIRVALDKQDYSKYIKNSRLAMEKKIKEAQLSREEIKRSLGAVKSLFEELDNKK